MLDRPLRLQMRLLLAVLLAVALVATGCGDDDDDGQEATDTTAATGTTDAADAPAPETTELKVGVLPTLGVAAFYLAIENGYFEEEGLTVTPEMAFTGVTEALVAGEYDMVYAAYTVPFQAIDRGLELKVVAEADRAATTPNPEGAGVVVMPDSDIEGPEDLVGKKIAAPTVAIGQLILYPGFEAIGIDPEEVEIVEIPFPNMLQAMESGNVDAVTAPEPLFTQALQTLDARGVFDPFEAAGLSNTPIAGFHAKADFAEENPGTVAAFRRALARAAEEANGDRAVVEGVLPAFMDLPPEIVADVNLPDYRAEPDAGKLQEYIETMTEIGLLENELKAEELIA